MFIVKYIEGYLLFILLLMATQEKPTISFENTEIAFSSKSNGALRKIYLLFWIMNNRFMTKIGTSLVNFSFKLRLPVKWLVKKTVFSHFCGGESIEDSEKTMKNLAASHIGTILDYSVEGEKTEQGFDATTVETIRTIDKAVKHRDKMPFCVFKVTGVALFDLLAKVQAKENLSEEEEIAWGKAIHRVDKICKHAWENKVRIFIDGEETWIQDTIDMLAYMMMEKYNQEEPIVYNTYQMYRHASYNNLKESFQNAEKENYWLGAKLVRGAYMEKERERAKELGYEDPIQPNKQATDEDFDKGLLFCVENRRRIAFCAGTHNEKSSHYLTELMAKFNISSDDTNVYFSQLYGMSDHISYNLANAGYNVAKYVPYGPVKAVMPYLIRRADENTSVAGQSSREFMLIKKERKRRKQKS